MKEAALMAEHDDHIMSNSLGELKKKAYAGQLKRGRGGEPLGFVDKAVEMGDGKTRFHSVPPDVYRFPSKLKEKLWCWRFHGLGKPNPRKRLMP
jgi:hypothetical protein